MQGHVIYCLAWGDRPNRDCGCTAGAKLKSFVMRSLNKIQGSSRSPLLPLALNCLFFAPWLKLIACLRVG